MESFTKKKEDYFAGGVLAGLTTALWTVGGVV
jgi:hypothetical protein